MMIVAGGPVFWILVALAVVAVFTYFERLLDLRRAQIDYQDFIRGVVNVLASGNAEEALAICDEESAPVARVVASAIVHRDEAESLLRNAVDAQGRVEIGRLDRRLAVLAIIGQVSPLLGLVGTIVGFMKTVLAANTQTVVSRADLLNGSMEALVCAVVGLVVAVLAVVMYGSLKSRLDRTVVELEAAANEIVGYVCGRRESAK